MAYKTISISAGLVYFSDYAREDFMSELEQSFGISLGDDFFDSNPTLSQLYNEIFRQIELSDYPVNCHKAALDLLHNKIEVNFGRSVTSETELSAIFPMNVKWKWRVLESETGLKFPSLRMHIFTAILIVATGLAVLSIVDSYRLNLANNILKAFLVLPEALAIMLVSAWLIRTFSYKLPVRTIDELALCVAELNYAKVCAGKFDSEQIKQIIRGKIARHAKCGEAAVTDNLKIYG